MGKNKEKGKKGEKKKGFFDDITSKVSNTFAKGHVTHDSDFENLVLEFNDKKKLIDIVTSDVTAFMGGLDGLLAAQEKLSLDMQSLFPSLSNTARLCEAQMTTIRQMNDTKTNSLDPLLQEHFQDPIKLFLIQYREVSDRIRERNRRQSNMDKLITKIERYTKEESPKLAGCEMKLTYAKQAYEELNEELKKDIPLLMTDSVNFFLPVLQNFIYTQSVFWSSLGQHATNLSSSQGIVGPQSCTFAEVITPKSVTATHKSYAEDHNPWGNQQQPQGNDPYAQPQGNDPYAQPSYGQAKDPYAQPSYSQPQQQAGYSQPQQQPSYSQPPPPARPSHNPKVKGLWAFQAENPNELSFNAGDIIEVLEQTGEWWKGTVNGRTGVFPANYVAPV